MKKHRRQAVFEAADRIAHLLFELEDLHGLSFEVELDAAMELCRDLYCKAPSTSVHPEKLHRQFRKYLGA
ncbi:MAG: hypothetical protein KC492_16615 [Myxococcales bacterium]|nr:hypothetical protein [Myxococcales bacterium]